MSNNWAHDIMIMHEKYGVFDKVQAFDKEKLNKR
jgi:hypothetical protein